MHPQGPMHPQSQPTGTVQLSVTLALAYNMAVSPGTEIRTGETYMMVRRRGKLQANSIFFVIRR